MVITTSICANYLPKAKTLAKSIKRAHPEAKIVLSLVEKDIHQAAQDTDLFDKVITPSMLGFENIEKTLFKYSIVEASTAV